MRTLEDQAFFILLIAISVAFAWVLWPYYGAVLWGTVTAIMFAPLYRQLSKFLHQRQNLAALTTLLIIVTMVILPGILTFVALLEEASSMHQRIHSGGIDLDQYMRQVRDTLPAWATQVVNRLGLTNLGAIQDRLSADFMRNLQALAGRAFDIGQSMLGLIVSLGVMLYLLFFLLRDGDVLARRIRDAVPLRANQRNALVSKFIIVIRATIKGSILVAVLQGALGGVIFWVLGIPAALLWAVLMAFLALLPAVGTALVWGPVAIYFLATGAMWQGVVLIAYGVLVIGLVDNILRPVLVGKDTKMPDYVVLISTLGGIATFGFHGFVIGPVIASMFMALWEIFSIGRQEAQTDRTGHSG